MKQMVTREELSAKTLTYLKVIARDLGVKHAWSYKLKDHAKLVEEILKAASNPVTDQQFENGNSSTIVDLETGEAPIIEIVPDEQEHQPEKEKVVMKQSPIKKPKKAYTAGVLMDPKVGPVHRIDLEQRDCSRTSANPSLKPLKTLVCMPVYNDQAMICDCDTKTAQRPYDTSTPFYKICEQGKVLPVTLESTTGESLAGSDMKGLYRWAAYRAYFGRTPENPKTWPRMIITGVLKSSTPKLYAAKGSVHSDIIGEDILGVDNLFKATGALLMTPADFECVGGTTSVLRCLVIDSITAEKGYAIFDGTIFLKCQLTYKRAHDIREEKKGNGIAKSESIIGSAQFRTFGDDEHGDTLPAIKGRTNNDFELFKYVFDTYVKPNYPHIKIEDIDMITTRDNIKTRKSHAKAGVILQIPTDAARFVRCKMNKWSTSLGRQAYRLDHEIVAKIRDKYGADENAKAIALSGMGDPAATKKIFIDSESESWDDLIGQLLRVMWLMPGNRTPEYKSVFDVKRAFEHNYWLKSVVKCKLYNKDLKFCDALYAQDDPRLEAETARRFKETGKLEWCISLPKGKEWDAVAKKMVSVLRYPIVTDYNAQGVVVVGRNHTKDTIYVPPYLLAIMFGDGDGDTLGLLVDDEIQFPMTARKLEPKSSTKILAKTEQEYVDLICDVADKIIDASTNTGLMDNALTQVIIANMRYYGENYDFRKYRVTQNTLGINVQAIIEGFKHMVSKSGVVITKPREYCGQFAEEGKLLPSNEEHVELNLMKKDVGGWSYVSKKQDDFDDAPETFKARLKGGTQAAAMRLSELVHQTENPALPKSPMRKSIEALKGYKPELRHSDSEIRRAQCANVWHQMLGIKTPWIMNSQGVMVRNEDVQYINSQESIPFAHVVSNYGLLVNAVDPKTQAPMYRWSYKTIMALGKYLVDSYNKITNYYLNVKFKGADLADDRRRAFIKLGRTYQSYIITEWLIGDATNFRYTRGDIETLVRKALAEGTDLSAVSELLGNRFDIRVIDNEEIMEEWDDLADAPDTLFIHRWKEVDNQGNKVTQIISYAKTKERLNGYTKDGEKLIPNECVGFQRQLMAYVGTLAFGLSRSGIGQGGSAFWCFDKLHCIDWMIRYTSEQWNVDLTEYEDISKRLKTIRKETYAIEERARIQTFDVSDGFEE